MKFLIFRVADMQFQVPRSVFPYFLYMVNGHIINQEERFLVSLAKGCESVDISHGFLIHLMMIDFCIYI